MMRLNKAIGILFLCQAQGFPTGGFIHYRWPMVGGRPIKRLPTVTLPQRWKLGAPDICKTTSAFSLGKCYLFPSGRPTIGICSVTRVMCL